MAKKYRDPEAVDRPKASHEKIVTNLVRVLAFLDGHERTLAEIAKQMGLSRLSALRYVDSLIASKVVVCQQQARPYPFTYTASMRLVPRKITKRSRAA